MSPVKLLSIALMLAGIFFLGEATAQIKIGTNGNNIQPSSLLELESANQGFLLPRMANTIAIDALNPPNGMMIYKTTDPAGLYIRKNNQWEYITGSMNGDANFNSVTVNGPVTAISFSGPLTGNASTATLATTATNSNNSAVTNDISNPGTTYPVFVNSTPGNQGLRTSSGNLSYVPATGVLTARGFNGLLTGDVIGNASSAVDAENTVNVRIRDIPTNPATFYPTFVSANSGPLPANVASTKFTFTPLTGELMATTFRGALIGNASTATTVTGNVAAVNGGTGQTLYSPGDILFADASNTLARLPIGTQGTILRVDATNKPSWSSAGAGTVRSLSGVANRISIVDPTVEPIIDISSNYVGQSSINTLGTVTTGTWNAGIIPTTYGGTGANNLIANEILVGRGTGQPIGSISLVGTAGKVLTSNGPAALPTFETAGVGDMVKSVDQVIDGIKRFNDGTLILKGSGTGITTLKSDPNLNGIVTLPGGPVTLVGTTGPQTIFDKTLDAPSFTGTGNFQTLSGTQLFLGGSATPLTTTGQTGTGNIVMSSGPTLSSPTFTGVVTAGAINSSGAISATGGFNGTATNTLNVGALNAGAVEIGVNAASNASITANNTIVRRDASGNFTAGTITASGGLVGNASTATTLLNSRLIYGVSFNGSADLGGAVGPQYGGTGVNNGTNTLTLNGNVSHLGSPFTQTIRATVNSDVILPQSGTLFSSRPNSIAAADLLASLITKTGTGVPVFSDGPVFVGVPIAPTAAAATNNTQIATTAYTDGAVATSASSKQNTLTNSAGLAGALNDETGTGLAVFQTSPTLITPILGVARAQSIQGNSGSPVPVSGVGVTSSTITGTNLSGTIQIVSDGSGLGDAVLVTVPYAGALSYTNGSYPILTPANALTTTLTNLTQVYAVGAQTNFVINSGTNTLPAGTYLWNYMVTGR